MKMKLKHPNQSKPSLILCYATLKDGERSYKIPSQEYHETRTETKSKTSFRNVS